jgi:hypothetical protein
MRILLMLAAVVAVPPFFGCSSTPLKVAGTACNADSDCAAGLSCRALGSFTDAGCTTGAKACTKPCTIDTDCASLGGNFKCFAACDGSRACGATQ